MRRIVLLPGCVREGPRLPMPIADFRSKRHHQIVTGKVKDRDNAGEIDMSNLNLDTSKFSNRLKDRKEILK